MYRSYKTIYGIQQPPPDAGYDAFTPVWLGKQPMDEARKHKKKGKEKKTDIVLQRKLGDAIGWCKCMWMYHQHRKNTHCKPILDAHAASHTIVLGTPVSEFCDSSKQWVSLIDHDPWYRSLCVILKTVCLGIQASASNFNFLFCFVK